MVRLVHVIIIGITLGGCASEGDYENWMALQEEVSSHRERPDVGEEPTPATYECKYRCDGSTNAEWVDITATSAPVARQIITDNADGDGDGYNDYCTTSSVTFVRCTDKSGGDL